MNAGGIGTDAEARTIAVWNGRTYTIAEIEELAMDVGRYVVANRIGNRAVMAVWDTVSRTVERNYTLESIIDGTERALHEGVDPRVWWVARWATNELHHDGWEDTPRGLSSLGVERAGE